MRGVGAKQGPHAYRDFSQIYPQYSITHLKS